MPKGRLRQLVGFSDRNRDGGLDADEWRIYAGAHAAENGLRAIKLGGKGDTTTTSLQWKYPRSIPQLPSPLLYQGVLYIVNDGGILTMLHPKSGEVIKQMRLRGAVDHYYASPVAADGKVFFVSQAGAVTVLRAGDDPEILSVNELNEESYATPAIADGRVYIRTASTLYCFGKDL
jgi:outer membrane protein assembly factor BamB